MGSIIGIYAREFTMTEKPKRLSRDRLRTVEQIRNDLDSPEPSRRERAIGECGDFASHAGAILVALVRGLNDPDYGIRALAIKGLFRAFPVLEDEATISRLLSEIESNEPEVRLAAIDKLLIILPQVLAALSGRKPGERAPTSKQPNSVREDLMEYAGRWVAWTRDRQRVLAVANSFADVMEQAIASGESDPYVKKVPGVSLEAAHKPFAILEDESSNILDDVRKVFPDPDAWLDAPNSFLGGERPRDLISTEREREVRYLLRGIKDGITT
jgi:HEAT repeat protein